MLDPTFGSSHFQTAVDLAVRAQSLALEDRGLPNKPEAIRLYKAALDTAQMGLVTLSWGTIRLWSSDQDMPTLADCQRRIREAARKTADAFSNKKKRKKRK